MNPIAKTQVNGALPDLSDVLERSVTVLGSTGTIGVNTLDIIWHAREHYGPHSFPVVALTAQSNVEKLVQQARSVKPELAVIGDPSLYSALKEALSGTGIEVAAGRDAVVAAAARESDIVMVGIIGAAGLAPALAAVERGAIVALANKECVVAAGAVFSRAVERSTATVIPVDSEHNAAFQILDGRHAEDVERVTLTASGGPFRDWAQDRMRGVTPEEAIAHPNWSMGAKISVDSASLMNKGLELIEAHFLFGLPADKLAVVVHPQSVVHCLVSYGDGTTLAHLSAPDMRTPIAHALAYPRRIDAPSRKLDLATMGPLTFQAPDTIRFPCLSLALDCLRAGGSAPTVLNAANEIAVQAFLERRIGFLDIARVVGATLEGGETTSTFGDLDAVLAADAQARVLAGTFCKSGLF